MIGQEYFEKVKRHFNGDTKKAFEWFNSTNPYFGILTPLNAIKLHKEKSVIDFINKHMR